MKSKILRRFLYPILRAMLIPIVAAVATQFLTRIEKSNKSAHPLMRRGLSLLRTIVSNISK